MPRQLIIAGGAILIALTLSLAACSSVKPDAGVDAVLIEKPMIFGHGGVDPNPIKTGRSYVAWTTDSVLVDMKPVEWSIPFNDLMTKDGVPMHFDATVVLQITDSVKMVSHFGPKWFDNNIDAPLRNLVRQAVRKHGMNEVAIDTSAIEAIDNEVLQGLTGYISAAGIPIRIIRLTVGKANPPDAIKDQRVETAKEEQRQKTESMTQAAEVARKQAEMARADADNAYRSQMSLSPEQFVELERIHMMNKVCADGKCTFIVGNATALVGH